MLTDDQRAPFTIPGQDGIDLIAQWIVDPATDDVIGMHARHADPANWPECCGGGYIAWVRAAGTPAARHQLIAGGPSALGDLTISPSLWHRSRGGDGNSPHRGCHGFIRSGRWEIA